MYNVSSRVEYFFTRGLELNSFSIVFPVAPIIYFLCGS
jgi:hypothetical protein